MVGIVVGILALGVLVIFLAKPSALGQGAEPSSSSTQLVLESKEYDFGTISMARGKVNTVFKVKNPSSQSATIKKIYTSCMCTSASFIKGNDRLGPFGMQGHGFIPNINQELRAGEEAQIEVVFDPAAHGPSGIGSITRQIILETGDNGKLALEISATVTP